MRDDLAIKNLEEIKAVFDKFAVEYWLDLGTLLGAVRDRRILPWDDDVDIGVREANWIKILSLVSEFRKKGFYVEVDDWNLHESYVYRYITLYRLGWFMGIYPYRLLKTKDAIRPDIRESFLTRSLMLLYHLLFLDKAHVSSKNKWLLKIAERLISLIPKKLKKPLSRVVFLMLQLLRKTALEYYLVVIPKHHFDRHRPHDRPLARGNRSRGGRQPGDSHDGPLASIVERDAYSSERAPDDGPLAAGNRRRCDWQRSHPHEGPLAGIRRADEVDHRSHPHDRAFTAMTPVA